MKSSLLLVTTVSLVSSQTFNWTWTDGGKVEDQKGMYPIKGSPSLLVYPGARSGHSASLRPQTNEFILFGGSTSGFLNDLWSYNFTSYMWTWLSGSDQLDQIGVYGRQRIANPTNQPGGRHFHVIDIHSTSDFLILFAGEGYSSLPNGLLNDMWTFDFASEQWTWISGSNGISDFGRYGTKGIASSVNVPCSRSKHSMNIHPHTRNVIIFGGTGSAGDLNDLWSFDWETSMWTWLTGYNPLFPVGIGSSNPGALFEHSSAINSLNGNLLMFGGSDGSNYNGLWSYNFTANQWTLISGSRTENQAGRYGIKGVSSPNNVPGARHGHQISFMPNLNSLLLFGGNGNGRLNDVWLHNFTSKEWVWIAGSNTRNRPGIYGTKGIPDISNVPGSRNSFAFDCWESLDKCVLFGGEGYDSTASRGILNDLWTFNVNLNETIIITQPSISSVLVVRTTTNSISSSSKPISTVSRFPSPVAIISNSLSSANEYFQSTSEAFYLVVLSDNPSSSSTSTKITSQQNQNSSTYFRVGRLYFIYGIIGCVFIFICCIFIKFLYCGAKKKTQTNTLARISNSSSFGSISYNSLSNNSSSSVMTKVPENQGISIPGFLQFKFGLDFRIKKEIAKGGMGTISVGDAFNQKLKMFGDKIIIKQIKKEKLTERQITIFYQEVAIMSFLKENKNIAKIIGFSTEPFCILMKYYEYGTLYKWIKSPEYSKSFNLIICFLMDIAQGVEAMHSKDLAHCDLKPKNVLIDWDPHEKRFFCVITDFGITQIVSDENLLIKAFNVVNVTGASMAYAAPENIRRVRDNEEIAGKELYKCDIYAIGIIMNELFTRKLEWK